MSKTTKGDDMNQFFARPDDEEVEKDDETPAEDES